MEKVGKRFSRAVVFGASGGVGAALCETLAERGTRVWAGSRTGPAAGAGEGFAFDLEDEGTIADAANAVRSDPPDAIIVATGVLTLPDGTGPERSLKQVDPAAMARIFAINTIGPALIAKHFAPLLARRERGVFAVLSARVGSIGDNRLGGWHSYRASKAALNMLVCNWSIELARTHPEAVVCALHPGTVDTRLSRPFQANVPEGQLFTPRRSARALVDVLEHLTPENSGDAFDWQGKRIEP